MTGRGAGPENPELDFAKQGASIVGAVYVVGYLVVTFRWSQFDVIPVAWLRLQYLAAGIWCLLPVTLFSAALAAHEGAVLMVGHSPYGDQAWVSAILAIRLPLYPKLGIRLISQFSSELVRSVLRRRTESEVGAQESLYSRDSRRCYADQPGLRF
jgi:hypothetical protein